jgi:uncharacterized membrane protein
MADLIAIGYPDETTAIEAEADWARLMGKLEKSGIDKEFQEQVRDLLQPGTSALFLVVEKVTPDKAVEALSKYGGTVLKSSLSHEAEQELQQELHGSAAQLPVNA